VIEIKHVGEFWDGSYTLHPEPHSNECGLFFNTPAAQVYWTFPLLHATQACIIWAKAIFPQRNMLVFNTYMATSHVATNPRNAEIMVKIIRFFLHLCFTLPILV